MRLIYVITSSPILELLITWFLRGPFSQKQRLAIIRPIYRICAYRNAIISTRPPNTVQNSLVSGEWGCHSQTSSPGSEVLSVVLSGWILLLRPPMGSRYHDPGSRSQLRGRRDVMRGNLYISPRATGIYVADIPQNLL